LLIQPQIQRIYGQIDAIKNGRRNTLISNSTILVYYSYQLLDYIIKKVK